MLQFYFCGLATAEDLQKHIDQLEDHSAKKPA